MLKNKKRTLITFAGILVMVILMTAVFIGKDSIMEFMKKVVEADQGKWHIQVYDVDKELADGIATIKSVDRIAVSRPLGYTEFPQSGNPEYTPFLEIKGYSDDLFDWMNIKIIEGHAPENDNEILISERAIKEGADIKPGDTIDVDAFERYIYAYYKGNEEEKAARGEEVGCVTFLSGFRAVHGETTKLPAHFGYLSDNPDFKVIHEPTGFKKSVTVCGIMEEPYYEAKGQAGYMALMKTSEIISKDQIVNLVLTTDLNSKEDCFGEILKLIDDRRSDEERAALEKEGTYYTLKDGRHVSLENDRVKSNGMLLTFSAKGSDGNFNTLMVFAQAFFIILITAAALILIYNVFSISYNERSRYLGMLSSVGATRKQKRWSVYYEVFSLLIPAIPLGILLGLGLVKAAMGLLYPHFAEIINMIVTNVINGKSCNIPADLVVNPVNIIFIIVFSAVAVWLSAWIPALKISKVGPFESIRGNDAVAVRNNKSYKSDYAYMMKGNVTQLLAAASVSRNRHSTKGIVRSITAFIALTLVTAFAVKSFTDIFRSKASHEAIMLGEKYNGYSYAFSIEDDEQYYPAVSEIINSDETEDFKELDFTCFPYYLSISDHSDEYRSSLKEVIGKWFPDGIPDEIYKSFLEPESFIGNPVVNILKLSKEDYEDVAKKAGIEIRDKNSVMAYDTVKLTTDDYRFGSDGAVKPDYAVYQLNNVLNVKPGESFTLMADDYDSVKEDFLEVDIPLVFAGYADAAALSEYVTLDGPELWLIVSEETAEYLSANTPENGRGGIRERVMLFGIKDGASDLIRTLSQIKNQFGDSALTSAAMYNGYTDFKNALMKIVSIVAVCFTLLIAVICMLNLYNSVMGRRLSRQHELSVLNTMGITKKQRNAMLIHENIRLIIRSLTYSALITAAFVICLRMVLNSMFGNMLFSLPVRVIVITTLISCVGLIVFTAACYNGNRKNELIDEVRTEVV